MKNLTKTYITNSRIDFYQISKNLTRQFTFANIFKHKTSIKIYLLIGKINLSPFRPFSGPLFRLAK